MLINTCNYHFMQFLQEVILNHNALMLLLSKRTLTWANR